MKGLVHSPSAHTQPGSASTVADILAAAADELSRPHAWTVKYLATDGEGNEVYDPAAPEAECWCVAGMLQRLAGYGDLYDTARQAVLDVIGGDRIADWNDAPGRTQAEVVAALRAAAEKATTASAGGTEPQSGGVHP